MDNVTSINTLAESVDVLGGGADLIAGTGKKENVVENMRGKTMAYLAAINVLSTLYASPKGDDSKEIVTLLHPNEDMTAVYTTSESGLVCCSFVSGDNDEPVIKMPTVDVTKRQLYDAIKAAVVAGLTANEAKAFENNRLNIKQPAHLALLVTPTSKKVGSRISDFKKGAVNREHEVVMDNLQAEEDKAAEAEGREKTDVRKAAQESSTRTGLERIMAGMSDLSRIASNDEHPDEYSTVKFKAWVLTGYTVLDVKPPVEKAGDEK